MSVQSFFENYEETFGDFVQLTNFIRNRRPEEYLENLFFSQDIPFETTIIALLQEEYFTFDDIPDEFIFRLCDDIIYTETAGILIYIINMIPEQRLYSMKEQIPDGEINILQAILSCNIDTELESDAIRMKMRMIERFMTNRNLWDMFLWTWNGETLFDDAIRNNMYELVVFLKKNFEFVMGPGTINAFNTLIRVPNGRRSFAEIQSIVKIWKLLPISLMIPFPTMINITESNRGRFSEDLFEESYEILLEED